MSVRLAMYLTFLVVFPAIVFDVYIYSGQRL